MTAAVITAALFFCNITPFKNAAKDSLPCPDNTNKFILFWVKFKYMFCTQKNYVICISNTHSLESNIIGPKTIVTNNNGDNRKRDEFIRRYS